MKEIEDLIELANEFRALEQKSIAFDKIVEDLKAQIKFLIEDRNHYIEQNYILSETIEDLEKELDQSEGLVNHLRSEKDYLESRIHELEGNRWSTPNL